MMSFDRKLESYNLNIFFLFKYLVGKGQCFTCHLMASLNEYVNVAFSLQISSCKIENNYKREPLGQLMLYYLAKVIKTCTLSFKTKEFILKFTHIYYL